MSETPDFFSDVGGTLVAAVAGSSVGRGNERQGASLSSPKFQGSTFNPLLDEQRLTGQLKRVRDLMKDEVWRTLAEISEVTGDPESSISARLRDLRKPKFGFYIVNSRRRSQGLFEYQIKEAL